MGSTATSRRWQIVTVWIAAIVVLVVLSARVEISDRYLDRHSAKLEDIERIERAIVSSAVRDCVRANAVRRELLDTLKDYQRSDALLVAALLPRDTPEQRERVAAYREQTRLRLAELRTRPAFRRIDCVALRQQLET